MFRLASKEIGHAAQRLARRLKPGHAATVFHYSEKTSSAAGKIPFGTSPVALAQTPHSPFSPILGRRMSNKATHDLARKQSALEGCKQACAIYDEALEKGDYATMNGLFALDAVREGPNGTLSGREAIMNFQKSRAPVGKRTVVSTTFTAHDEENFTRATKHVSSDGKAGELIQDWKLTSDGYKIVKAIVK